MSRTKEQKSTGFLIAEKFFGIVILVIGSLTIYYMSISLNDIANNVGPKIAFFVQLFMGCVGAGLIALGIFLIFARTS
ncbi:hypothetical protein J7K06_06005 [Candidatus Bathyarchaeota archaeon]|nr:hypothetical protein [Candidatus Bathyarchaeota archaeon]